MTAEDEILAMSQIRLTTERGKTEGVDPATDREREKIRQIINSKSYSHMSIVQKNRAAAAQSDERFVEDDISEIPVIQNLASPVKDKGLIAGISPN